MSPARARTRLFALAALLGTAIPLHAQSGPDPVRPGQGASAFDDAYLDSAARVLHGAAMENWRYIDETVVRYSAVVRERLAAALRTPLKDRTLYRAEAASRVFWSRDGTSFVQVLASREQTPLGLEEPDLDGAMADEMFDPAGDRLLFGMSRSEDLDEEDGDDFWFHHPLAGDAPEHYRFRTGDTLTLTLPDGQALRAVELQALPREADVHRISGSLWIEPESGALVRATYRLADRFDALRDIEDLREEEDEDLRHVPGIFKPWTFDLSLVVVDYALWDFEVWLPRALRMEGVVQAGILKAPGSFDVSYRVESVLTESDVAREEAGEEAAGVLAERHFETREEAMAFLASLMTDEDGVAYEPLSRTTVRDDRRVRYLAPEDRSVLVESSHLPPPIWEDAPGFLTEDDIEEMEDVLADLPQAAPPRAFWAANWGFERPDLIRYNRVEGPAVGARVQGRVGSPFGPVSLALQPFVGLADLEVKARGSATWESLRRRVSLGAYRELRSAGLEEDHLGLGNSLTALLFGRDEGEYFLATGGDVRITPPAAERQSWSLRLYGERHHAVERETDFALTHAFDDGWTFRDNITASRHDEYGAEARLAPWWGTDPLLPQAGADLYLQGATGDLDYGRASVVLRGVLPFEVGDSRWRTALEVGAGESWGDVPVQRFWYLGSTSTLRSYPASTLVGPSYTRARGEVGRVFPAVTVSLFGDAGWTGDGLDAFESGDALVSAGIGASLLDGLLRIDLSRGLRDPEDTRLDFYLDAAF